MVLYTQVELNILLCMIKKRRELDKINGYIDIGLHDTMSDLIVNFIGALVYCILGYLYIINKKKYKIIDKLIIKKV